MAKINVIGKVLHYFLRVRRDFCECYLIGSKSTARVYIKCGIFKKEVLGLNMAEIKNSELDMSTQQKAELDKEKRREERSKKTALQGTE